MRSRKGKTDCQLQNKIIMIKVDDGGGDEDDDDYDDGDDDGVGGGDYDNNLFLL